MLLIGSRALVANNPELEGVRKTIDWDFICTIEQFTAWHKANKGNLQFAVPTQQGKYYHARDKDGMNYEFELAWEGTSALVFLQHYGLHNHVWKPEIGPVPAIDLDLLMIKLSHRYKRNSPHFLKTMSDIKFLRKKLGDRANLFLDMPLNKQIMAMREKESYDYAHPRLNVSSKDFFNGDGVQYVYDHDSIHEAVALYEVPVSAGGGVVDWKTRPAYTFYMKDGSEVMTSKEKFMSVPERIRLYGVYEESCVLALERSQIPHGMGKEGGPTARQSFEMALSKVCTSITSGWFREYAWENYQKVLDLYNELGENDYIERFNRNNHLLKAYTGENY
ncbi:hypothetical protein QGX21_gp084 [Pseudomonas phage phiPsa315]|uniref:Uncharacterized protein n=1 Tax=Pseudomonas phage phiPsa315 TaxID=1460363 RepID=A0A7G9V1R8_9CAUD|nr:hypothetical protein QGX21_gp084 [Pseudomonas phage phiPsa315]QNO00224.1 hypothetical protein phiPsa315_142 [Pseudomonas phage phiPsa315]